MHATAGSAGPSQSRGSRNLMTHGRSITPSGGKGRRVKVVVRTKDGDRKVVVNVPFHNVPLYICAENVPAVPNEGKAVMEAIPRGAILVRNADAGRRKGEEPIWIVYPKGLFQALRGQAAHTLRGYAKELRKLSIAVDELPTALQLSWNLPGNNPAAVKAYKAKLLEILETLRRSRDPKKAEAVKKLQTALSCVDSLGRFNPPAMSARLGAVLSRSHDRIEMAHVVSHQMDARRMVLSIILDRVWAMVQDLGLEVSRDRKRFDQIRGDAAKVEAMAKRFERLAVRFETVDIAPYGTHAFPHEVYDLRLAAEAVRKDQVATFRAATDRIERSVLLLAVHRRIEDALLIASLAKEESAKLTPIDRSGAMILVDETRIYLEKHLGLDRGFKRKIQADITDAMYDAKKAIDARDAKGLYEALVRAAKCF